MHPASRVYSPSIPRASSRLGTRHRRGRVAVPPDARSGAGHRHWASGAGRIDLGFVGSHRVLRWFAIGGGPTLRVELSLSAVWIGLTPRRTIHLTLPSEAARLVRIVYDVRDGVAAPRRRWDRYFAADSSAVAVIRTRLGPGRQVVPRGEAQCGSGSDEGWRSGACSMDGRRLCRGCTFVCRGCTLARDVRLISAWPGGRLRAIAAIAEAVPGRPAGLSAPPFAL
jgi:hypothetical protein